MVWFTDPSAFCVSFPGWAGGRGRETKGTARPAQEVSGNQTNCLVVAKSLLFLVYINDVASLHYTPGTDLSVFADDMLLYRCIDSWEDVQYRQQDSDITCRWGTAILPSERIKMLIVTRKGKQASTSTILFEGTPLERVDTFKVILFSDLSWTPQVELFAPKLVNSWGCYTK